MLIQKIESIIQTLKAPVTSDESGSGWTESIMVGYVPFFANLIEEIRAGKEIPYIGIVRSLDAYGIEGGRLYEAVLEVARELNAKS
jgi:hypothetical protein